MSVYYWRVIIECLLLGCFAEKSNEKMINKLFNELPQWKSGIPLVSICCITYNQASYLSEAIDGFLSQETDFPFEIIIGDDASSDGTRSIIEKYEAISGGLITAVVNDTNIGATKNISKVMSLAQGKYIAICEGDDYWHDPHKLQLQVDFLESHPSFSMCCHDYKIRNGDDVFVNQSTCGFNVLTFKEYAKSLPNIQTLTVVFRNELHPLIPEHIINKVTGSVFIFLRLAEIGDIKYIPTALATYRVHAAGIWSGKTEREKGSMALQNIDAMRDYFSQNQKIMRLLTERYVYQTVTFANYSLLRFSLRDFLFFAKKSVDHGLFVTHIKAVVAFYRKFIIKAFSRLLRIS